MRPRLILADDYGPILDRLSSLLRIDFDIVALATDGQVALDLILEHSPELAILDIAMPVLNGFETARRVRELRPQVKIILFTNHNSPIYQREALKIGCSDLIAKSSSGDILLEAVWHAISSSSDATSLVKTVANSR